MKAGNKKCRRKSLVSIALLFTVVFSLASFINPAMAETSGLAEGASKPTVESIDFYNGTTLTLIDYHNGTRDEITETILTRCEYQLVNGTADQSLTMALPARQEESTDYVTVTQDAVLEQEVLMGFTYILAQERWTIIDASADLWLLEAYAKAGIEVDIGFGLRLPVRITLEYPEQMTVEHDYELYATLTPLDRPDFDEFLRKLKAVIWVEAGVWTPVTGWVEYSDSWGPDYDWSRSFATPLGPAMEFPIPSLEITVWDFWLMEVKVVMGPQLGSDKVTARASATGDATGDRTIRWSAPDQRIPFTVHAGDYDPTTDYAEIQLSDFRYYFTIFKLHLKLKFDFDGWIDWLTGDPEIRIYTLDMSWLTGGLYLRVHEGTPGVVSVDIFVEKFGVRLITVPAFRDIAPGDTVTYKVIVIDTGNVPDTYILSLEGLPVTWYSFSATSISLDPGQAALVTLIVSPPYAGLILKDYAQEFIFPFTITATSGAAPDVSDSVDAGRVNYTPILPPLPEGGLLLAVKPKVTTTTAGTEITVDILVVNNENFDDVITVKLGLEGIPPAYRANLAWMSWTELKVFVPAGDRYTIPLAITIPTGTASGNKVFKVEATSAVWDKGYAMTSGAIKVG